jgi:hypothetical protein
MSDEKAQHAPPGGAGPYSGLFFWLQPDSNEFVQAGAVIIEDPECAVPGPGHGAGLFDHVAEEYRQLEIPLNE